MRMPTFNKQEETSICLFCKKNRVSIKKWNKPCDECKETLKKKKTRGGFQITKRQPAAVWEDDDGNRTFVDKFGKPVQDHGYDLDNDLDGRKTTGRGQNKKEIII